MLLLPVHRLLSPDRGGPAAAATVTVTDAAQGLVLWGTATLLLAALALGLMVPLGRLRPALDRIRGLLSRPRPATFAAILGAAALGTGVAVARGVHRGLPRLFDAMVQLLHARYFAAGRLAAPVPSPAGRLVQNSVLVPEGWASVYPPGHTALLAAGHLLGAPWLVGPLLLGLTAAFTYLAVDRLYPQRPGTTRLAGLLVALSPFLVFAGSGYLSHATVAACAAGTLYFALRSSGGASAWALPAGAMAGLAVAARPWSGLVLGAFLSLGVLLTTWWREGRSFAWLGARVGWTALGGLPFALALLGYDRRVFGAPLRLGYEVAFGPAHGLGFHPDPWGNLYGLREALGYTAADVATLGLHLFETPLSGPLLVGLFLLVVPGLSRGTRILVGWALLPVAANAFYWHHGQHMGPRMLLEAAPAWAALSAVAGVGLVEGGRDPGATGRVASTWSRRSASAVLVWAAILALPAGAFYILPSRVDAYRWRPDALARATPPPLPADAPALVFVHGSWAGRVAARLAAAGMRRDSVETALRRNDLCRVHLYERARSRGEAPAALPPLDLEPRPGRPAALVPREVGGVRVFLGPGRLEPVCAREVAADRFGGVELAPLLWQTALPGGGGPLLLYRDLGPSSNARVLARFPGRTAYVHAPGARRGQDLIPYEEGMELLWGDAPDEGTPGPRVSGGRGP
jgi:hypothetical protein